jgi:hypothetical protein
MSAKSIAIIVPISKHEEELKKELRLRLGQLLGCEFICGSDFGANWIIGWNLRSRSRG